VRTLEEAVRIADESCTDAAMCMANYALAVALLHRDSVADRDRGLQLMQLAQDIWRGRVAFLIPVTELWIALERAKRGDRAGALPLIRAAADEVGDAARLGYGVWGTAVLVETLLEEGTADDLAAAHSAIERLASVSADDSAICAITLVRLRALMSRARGEHDAFRVLAARYLAMATSLGFAGHADWAAAMVEAGERDSTPALPSVAGVESR
jgi:hypothetical protein